MSEGSNSNKFIDTILVSVELMLSLIDDILDNAKLDRNNFKLMSKEFKIRALFEEVKNLFDI